MSPRKAAQPASYRVWSWWQGSWWMVDHGTDRDLMVASAQRRQNYAVSKGINPDPRFIPTVPGQTPEQAWLAKLDENSRIDASFCNI